MTIMAPRGFLPQFSRADIIIRGTVGGVSDEHIAVCLGIGRSALQMWRKKHAKELAKHTPADPRPTNTAMARLLTACGVRLTDAANVTGQLQQATTNSRQRASITPRYQPQHASIVQDFRGGMSARRVAEKYSIAEASVYTLANLYGAPLTDAERKRRQQRKSVEKEKQE